MRSLALPKLVWVGMIYVAIIVSLLFVARGMNGYERANFGDLVYGHSWKPFCYRTLVPITVRSITSAIPASVRQNIENRANDRLNQVNISQRVRLWFEGLQWDRNYIVEHLVSVPVVFFCVLAYMILILKICDHWIDMEQPARCIAPILAGLLLPLHFNYYSYLYDPGTWVVFPLAVLFISRKQWWPLLVLFPIAVLQKETAILLVLLWLIRVRSIQQPLKLSGAQVAVLLGLYIAIKAVISHIFIHNKGSFVEFHLLDHNLQLVVHQPLVFVAVVAGIALLTALIRSLRLEAPSFLLLGFGLCFAAQFGLAIFFGFVEELRGYYELLPLIMPFVVVVTVRSMGLKADFRVSKITSQPL